MCEKRYQSIYNGEIALSSNIYQENGSGKGAEKKHRVLLPSSKIPPSIPFENWVSSFPLAFCILMYCGGAEARSRTGRRHALFEAKMTGETLIS